MRLPLVLTGLAACLLLASCADKTSHQAAPTTSAHDGRDATYTITCDGVVPDGFSAALHDGVAKVPADIGQTQFYDDFEIRLEATATGDLDGDGRSDTVVLLQCSPQPSNGIVEEVQVFDADDHLIAELPSPRTLREETILPPVYDPQGLKVEDGDIVAAMKAYAPDDSHASGPSIPITVRWHWNGRNFERVP